MASHHTYSHLMVWETAGVGRGSALSSGPGKEDPHLQPLLMFWSRPREKTSNNSDRQGALNGYSRLARRDIQERGRHTGKRVVTTTPADTARCWSYTQPGRGMRRRATSWDKQPCTFPPRWSAGSSSSRRLDDLQLYRLENDKDGGCH